MARRTICVAMALAVVACKKDRGAAGGGSGSGSASASVAPISTPPLGVEAVKAMSYVSGPGAKDFERARAAAKTPDWAAVAEACRAAIARDATHLDAHRLLATALVRQNQIAEAVDHLVIALAGDLLGFQAGLDTDMDLQ